MAHLKPDHLTIVTAGCQTAGRGRQDRKWLSPPDVNLYVSYVLFVPKERSDISNIPQIVTLAAAQVLHQLGFKALIKWPNDLVIGSKKLGGVLSETTAAKDKTAVIVGLGLNVNMPQEWLDKVPGVQATSLSVEKGHQLDLIDITEALQQAVSAALETYMKRGFTPFLQQFRELLAHRVGDAMRFHHGDNILEGSFHSINDNGTLNLILNDKVKTFASGEIV